MGILLIKIKFWNKNLSQTPKPNVYIHKNPPEVKNLIFLNFPYIFLVREVKSNFAL